VVEDSVPAGCDASLLDNESPVFGRNTMPSFSRVYRSEKLLLICILLLSHSFIFFRFLFYKYIVVIYVFLLEEAMYSDC